MSALPDFPSVPRPAEVEVAILDALDALDRPEEDEKAEPVVHDEGSADWALRKLARVREQHQGVNAVAERQIKAITEAMEAYLQPIRDWQLAETERLGKEEAFFEALLLRFHLARLAEDPRAKTIRLPHGNLSSRKTPDHWEFDADAFLDWARESAPELVRVKEEVDKAAAKKALLVATTGEVVRGGEVVPGVTVEPGEVRFSVDTLTPEVTS